jgi:cation diffusion facilitator family transporter
MDFVFFSRELFIIGFIYQLRIILCILFCKSIDSTSILSYNMNIIYYQVKNTVKFWGIEMNKQQGALLSIFSNTTLIIFKIIAGLTMNSISVLSEAIHSSIDLLASLIVFFSIRKAVEPEDADHPFGHGKYENVSGFVEAILIFFAAAIIIFEATKKIIEGSSVSTVGPGLIVMGISSFINFVISTNLFRIAKRTNSIALEADAMHLLTDVFTSLGVFIGLLLIKFTGIQILDPIFALIVAALIIKTSYDLTKKSMKDLVDSSLPNDEINTILEVIKSHPQIKSYHKLRTRKSGERREVDIHLQIDNNSSIADAHRISNIIEEEIKSRLTNTYIVVHVEPIEDIPLNS